MKCTEVFTLKAALEFLTNKKLSSLQLRFKTRELFLHVESDKVKTALHNQKTQTLEEAMKLFAYPAAEVSSAP